jgi:hypothetical protein
MKILITLLTGTALAGSVFLPSAAAATSYTRRGPDALHYAIRNNVGPTEFGPPTIKGTMDFQYTQKGPVVRQKMALNISGLETNATVSLTAGIGDDPANVVTAAQLPTDSKGRLRAKFVSVEPAPARPGRTAPLPDLLQPLTEVGAICVEDSSGQLVANSGVQDAYRFQYVAKRNLKPEDSNGTAAGSVTLIANQKRAKLTLLAGGLEPSTEYTLVMNGTPVGVVTSNDQGVIRTKDWPTEAPPVLQLRSFSLNGPGGAVLSTTFPRSE